MSRSFDIVYLAFVISVIVTVGLFTDDSHMQPVGAYISVVNGECSKYAIAPGSEVLIIKSDQNAAYSPGMTPVHHIHNNTYNSQVQKTNASASAYVHTLIEAADDASRYTHEQLIGFWDYLSTYVGEHRWHLAFLSITSSYALIAFRMLYLSYELNKPTWWSQWRKQLSLSELFSLDDSALIDDLLTCLQHRYTTNQTLENFSAPIVLFLTDIAREKKLLSTYSFWVRVRRYTGFASRLFPCNKELAADVSGRLERISFLHSRVMHYMSAKKVRESKK